MHPRKPVVKLLRLKSRADLAKRDEFFLQEKEWLRRHPAKHFHLREEGASGANPPDMRVLPGRGIVATFRHNTEGNNVIAAVLVTPPRTEDMSDPWIKFDARILHLREYVTLVNSDKFTELNPTTKEHAGAAAVDVLGSKKQLAELLSDQTTAFQNLLLSDPVGFATWLDRLVASVPATGTISDHLMGTILLPKALANAAPVTGAEHFLGIEWNLWRQQGCPAYRLQAQADVFPLHETHLLKLPRDACLFLAPRGRVIVAARMQYWDRDIDKRYATDVTDAVDEWEKRVVQSLKDVEAARTEYATKAPDLSDPEALDQELRRLEDRITELNAGLAQLKAGRDIVPVIQELDRKYAAEPTSECLSVTAFYGAEFDHALLPANPDIAPLKPDEFSDMIRTAFITLVNCCVSIENANTEMRVIPKIKLHNLDVFDVPPL